MAQLNLTHQDLYREIRLFLLGLFPDATLQIIQSAQNNQPLPENAIVMQVLFDSNLDESVTVYKPPEEMMIQNSVEVRLQLDFYGPYAESRSRVVANLWKSHYGTSNMEICKPLYVQSRQRHPYINDSNQYEHRFILDLGLQYNPEITCAQDFASEVSVNIIPEP